MLAKVGTALWPALFSKAQVCLAPSIWRKLLMQALCWALRRARTKLGMAMGASRPMMATTIMISTRGKPALRERLVFIQLVFFQCRSVNEVTGGLFPRRSQTACRRPRLNLLVRYFQ